MKVKVTASRLNVRSMPSSGGAKIGILTENTIVQVLGERNNWFEIRFNEGTGFVHSNYVIPVEAAITMKGRVAAERLNIRDRPGLDGNLLGVLVKGTTIDIMEEHDVWLEIAFNEQSAYVHSDYVDCIEMGNPRFGKVTAHALNVRSAPSASGTILGSLTNDSRVNIRSAMGAWYEIDFNDSIAYVHRDYVQIVGEQKHEGPLVFTPDDAHEADIEKADLAPTNQMPVAGSRIRKKVTRTWNRFGGLVSSLSGSFMIEPGAAIAVLCVESSGKGFEPGNQDRMIIRFENHLFWKYWGKLNANRFHSHFQYGKRERGKLKVWLGHRWRESVEDDWQTFHGNQTREWQVLEFARSLDDTATLYSISMGAPQILGSNHERIGYDSVQEMFTEFNQDIRHHIMGLFNFCNDRMIRALQYKDFVTFAQYYNGSGQKQKYGQWIQDHYDAFQSLTT